MKPILQLDRTGCAIASVAALTGRSYRDTKAHAAALGIDVSDCANWMTTGPMRRLLRRCGARAGAQQPFGSWEDLPDLALLAIKWHIEPAGPAWHWTVFVREAGEACVLDSKRALKVHRRTDFGRIKPKWFIPVVPARS